tara:strand:+ start:573 stop:755 length:183 start_codon:yes stop_codon:yes gene_type:complete
MRPLPTTPMKPLRHTPKNVYTPAPLTFWTAKKKYKFNPTPQKFKFHSNLNSTREKEPQPD